MATSRNIQYLGLSATGALINDADVSARSQTEDFIAGAAVAYGEWVVLDTSATGSLRAVTVVKAPASAVSKAVMGCVLEAATVAGQWTKVVVKGYHPAAIVNTSVALDDGLFCGGTAAGTAETYSQATATAPPCGIALEADTAGVAAVYVCGQY